MLDNLSLSLYEFSTRNLTPIYYGFILFIIIMFLLYITSILATQKNNLSSIDELIKKADQNTNPLGFNDLLNCNDGEFYIKNIRANQRDISYNFKLKDYYVKTAYNACCTGRFKNDYIDLKALENCDKNGIRALDFEIYSLNDEPIVGASSNNDYYYKETYNHINLSEAMRKVNDTFINEDKSEYHDYPLFLFFRINYGGNNLNSKSLNKDENYETKLKNFYNTIHNVLKSAFGDDNYDKFYSIQNPMLQQNANNDQFNIFDYDNKASMISSIDIQDTRNTIFLFISTNDNNHDILKGSELQKLTDIIIDNNSMSSYRYNDLEGSNAVIMSNKNKQSLSICLPSLSSSNRNYNPTRPITLGIQFIAMNYQNRDDNLVKYNSLFELSGCNANGTTNTVPLLKKPNKYIEVPSSLFRYFQNSDE